MNPRFLLFYGNLFFYSPFSYLRSVLKFLCYERKNSSIVGIYDLIGYFGIFQYIIVYILKGDNCERKK